MIGELGLNGEIKPVRGVLPIVRAALKNGITTCILPKENAIEGAVMEEMKIIGVSHFCQVCDYLSNTTTECIKPTKVDVKKLFDRQEEGELDFSDITGQEAVKRAAVIASAGFHHLLLVGVPGAGKTMIAKRMPTILPPLSMEESLEVSTIYSVSGLLDENRSLITKRPFFSPHHTTTATTLSGGGNRPKPGILSLCHRGVLFLDELPEFSRECIEVMRQPLEERKIHISRNFGQYTYPADFMLVAAMKPYPQLG